MTQTLLQPSQVAGLDVNTSSKIYIANGNTTVSPILTTAIWHPMVSAIGGTGPTIYGSGSSDFQYIPGQICPITSVANNGAGKARFYMPGGHPFITGDVVAIQATVAAYHGNLAVTYIDSTHFDTNTSFTATATGVAIMGDRLKCLLAANYYPFNYSYVAYFKAGTTNTIYTALINRSSAPWAGQINTVCADTTTYHRVCSGVINNNLSGVELSFAYTSFYASGNPTFASLIINIEPDLATAAP